MFRFFDQRKQAKMQWLQDPSQSNIDNQNNVRREDKKKEYLQAKVWELETYSKIKIINFYACRPDDGVYKDAETCNL
jgi:hypothetical protein